MSSCPRVSPKSPRAEPWQLPRATPQRDTSTGATPSLTLAFLLLSGIPTVDFCASSYQMSHFRALLHGTPDSATPDTTWVRISGAALPSSSRQPGVQGAGGWGRRPTSDSLLAPAVRPAGRASPGSLETRPRPAAAPQDGCRSVISQARRPAQPLPRWHVPHAQEPASCATGPVPLRQARGSLAASGTLVPVTPTAHQPHTYQGSTGC